MSQESYAKMEPKYKALLDSAVQRPVDGPVDKLVLEIIRVAKIADGDDLPLFEKLAATGLFELWNVTDLTDAAHGLSHAEALKVAYLNPEQSEELKAKLERLQQIRKTQLMDLDFVKKRHKPEGLASTLKEIRKGNSRSDALADVLALKELGKRFEEQLEEIAHDAKIDEEGAALSVELKEYVDADKEKMAAIMDMRNRAYTVAIAMYNEVREAGKFIFRNDPKRRSDYFSQI